MPYEEIQGEIMTMSYNDAEPGVSGVSTETPGALNKSVEVRWVYPGGISGLNNATYGDIWGGQIGSLVQEVINQYETGSLDIASFRTQVNSIVYSRVTGLLNQGADVDPSWNEWKETYVSCVTILS